MNSNVNIGWLKSQAKKLKKATPGMIHAQALNSVAKTQGFANWKHLLKNQKSQS